MISNFIQGLTTPKKEDKKLTKASEKTQTKINMNGITHPQLKKVFTQARKDYRLKHRLHTYDYYFKQGKTIDEIKTILNDEIKKENALITSDIEHVVFDGKDIVRIVHKTYEKTNQYFETFDDDLDIVGGPSNRKYEHLRNKMQDLMSKVEAEDVNELRDNLVTQTHPSYKDNYKRDVQDIERRKKDLQEVNQKRIQDLKKQLDAIEPVRDALMRDMANAKRAKADRRDERIKQVYKNYGLDPKTPVDEYLNDFDNKHKFTQMQQDIKFIEADTENHLDDMNKTLKSYEDKLLVNLDNNNTELIQKRIKDIPQQKVIHREMAEYEHEPEIIEKQLNEINKVVSMSKMNDIHQNKPKTLTNLKQLMDEYTPHDKDLEYVDYTASLMQTDFQKPKTFIKDTSQYEDRISEVLNFGERAHTFDSITNDVFNRLDITKRYNEVDLFDRKMSRFNF